jgi:citrate lyase beta subunit
MSCCPDVTSIPARPDADVAPYRVLGPELFARLDSELSGFDTSYTARYPGPPGPGPVHTVYIPVPGFDADAVTRWGYQAAAAVDANQAAWRGVLGNLVREDHEQVEPLSARTLAKLAAEPIEDMRIDFEDGFRAHRGTPADDRDEDEHALRAAGEMAGMLAIPRSWGIRIRSLAPETRRRGLRTLDLFVAELLTQNGYVPAGFVITLPKVTGLQQVEVFVEVLGALEQAHGLPPGSLRFEIQVETPQTLLGADGTVPLASMIHGGGGRVSGLHFGTYDYTASLGILGTHQDLRHPVADLAKGLMMLVAAETGVRVSDGSDNRIPIGDPETVRHRWARHADGVQRALRGGIYQGWDLHPAQLPTRFAATFAFFREGWSEAAERLGNYHRQASTGVMDEPATAFALARHLAAARSCGAVDADELDAVGGIGDDVVARYLVRGAVPDGSTKTASD